MKTLKKSKLLIVGLVIMLLGGVFANWIQTGFGIVKISKVSFQTENGYTLSGYLYKPDSATAENPAPAIITIHGYNDMSSALSPYNVELSRRGYVVFSIDMEGHGDSDFVPAEIADGSFGGTEAAEYVMNLDYVDSNQIGAIGHSRGSNAVMGIEKKYPDNIKAALFVGFLSGSIADGTLDEGLTHTNVGMISSRYDECGTDLMNHIIGNADDYGYFKNGFFNDAWGGDNAYEYVNKGVGNWEDGTMRIFYTLEAETHVLSTRTHESVEKAIDFIQKSIEAPKEFDASNQVWKWKYLGTLVEMIGFMLTVIGFASLLLSTKQFEILTAKMYQPKTSTNKCSALHKAVMIVIFTIIPAITFMPVYSWAENNAIQNKFLPLSTTGQAYLYWTISNMIVMVLVFVIWHFVYGKKHEGNVENYGIAFSKEAKVGKYIVLAVLCSVLVIVFAYCIMLIMQNLFHMEMYVYVFGIRSFNMKRMIYILQYFLPYFISFLLSGVVFTAVLRDDNTEETAGKNMAKNIAIGILQSVGGLIILFAFWNLSFHVNGTPIPELSTPYVMGNRGFMSICWALIPTFALTSIFNTYFNVKTKRIYVSAFVCALFVVWITFAGQSIGF